MRIVPNITALDQDRDFGWEAVRVMRNSVRQYMTNSDKVITVDEQSIFRANFTAGQRLYLLHTDTDHPIGYLYLRQVEDHWVPTYVVADTFRKQGYGRFLVQLSQLLAPAILLTVKPTNTAAHRLYASLGFREYLRTPTLIHMGWQNDSSLQSKDGR